MPIEFPEALQSLGTHGDLLEKWLHQMATVRSEQPKERIRMPHMLTSENLSTWLSTRYAAHNKSKVRALGTAGNDKIRRDRKKSSSERAHDLTNSEGYVEWLTPKRAKLVASNTSPSIAMRSNSPINFYDNVSVLPKQDSSRIVDLLAPFHEQICQMTHEDWVASKPVNPLAPFNGEATNTKTNEDWYTKWRPTTTSRSEDNDESSKGLLSPYFEATSNMKVDDWLAKHHSSLTLDSTLSEWLSLSCPSERGQSSESISASSTNDDLTSTSKPFIVQSDESFPSTWLGNERTINNFEEEDISDDDESLLDGLEGMNIGDESSTSNPDSGWLLTPSLEPENKHESERTWVIDDYGSFIWANLQDANRGTQMTLDKSKVTSDKKDEQLPLFNRSSPFNMNDWLVVASEEHEDVVSQNLIADDGSSIVVLSIHD